MSRRGADLEAASQSAAALPHGAFCPIGSFGANVFASRPEYLETFLGIFRQEMRPQAPRPHAAVDASFTLVGVEAPLADFAPPDGETVVWRRAAATGERELRTGRFIVALRGDAPLAVSIQVREPLYSAQAFRDRLLEVIAKALFTRRRLCLHAGAVLTDGQADVFAGDTRSGKTTLCLRFAAAGATILSEDRTLLTRGAGGFAASGYRDVCRITEQTERHFFPDGGVAARLRGDALAELRVCEGGKKEFPLAGVFPSAPYRDFPLRRLFFTHVGAALRVEPLSRQAALVRLLQFTQADLLPGDASELDALLEYLSALAAACEVFDLTLSRDLGELDGLVALLGRMSTKAHVLLHGTVARPCGFSLINRRLIDGLRRRGYSLTVVGEDGVAAPPLVEPPDVYLFHGDPFDFAHTPGRVNLFFLQWEYRHLPRGWVEILNQRFDALLVPSEFARGVCRRGGIRIPVGLCRAACDPREFHPGVPPVALPTRKRFRFVCLGGAHQRRGTDVLLRAFVEEFGGDEDVALIVKAFHYDHHREWVERALRDSGARAAGAPEVVYVHRSEPAIGGYYTAADVGVFPLRAECLGLPVLECIAAGRPVIVTASTGLDEFCNARNARFVRGRARVRGALSYLEPDRAQLRAEMRAAFERGALDAAARRRVSRSVAELTWKRSIDGAIAAIEDCLRARRQGPVGARAVGPSFQYAGASSAALPRPLLRGGARAAAAAPRGTRLLVAAAGHALPLFRDGTDGGAPARRVLCADVAPAHVASVITAAEAERCGLPGRGEPVLDVCQRGREEELADLLLVPGEAARRRFAAAGFAAARVELLPLAFPRRARGVRKGGAPRRFLFVSQRPLLDGLRVLFEAWQAAELGAARLDCVIDKSVLASPHLVRLLVCNPRIAVHGPLPAGRARALLEASDCAVLPSLAGGYAPFVGEAMACGRAVIVSDASGMCDFAADGESARVVAAGSVAALAAALVAVAADGAGAHSMGAAARATARRCDGPAAQRRLEESLGALLGRRARARA